MRSHRQRTTAAQRQLCGDTNEAAVRQSEVVRIELLGGFRLRVGLQIIQEGRWRLRKANSLIKLLALAPGHRLHREQVMEALWPGIEPRSAANNLHQILYAARRAFEPSALASSSASSSYLLLRDKQLILCPDSPLWVDAEAFQEAAVTARHAMEVAAFRAAIDLYAGDLLPGDRYEPWVQQRRAELRELYLSLLLELGGLLEERGEFGEAIEALGRIVAEEPTHEEAYVGLMRLQVLSGRRGEALSQYERLREALCGQFGREPEAATTRLQQEIRAGTFSPGDLPLASFPPGEATPSPKEAAGHNLPPARTSFIGREREMLEVKRHLAMTRLLTLTGTGGCGKTRLALEVARDLVGAYPDGVWFVELAPHSDPTLEAQAVAHALIVREQSGRPLLETLKDTLRPKKTLLVVDNCEHLMEGVVNVVDVLLDSCPSVRILATSRKTLNAADEVNWVVPSLTVPSLTVIDTRQQAHSPRELETCESVRLFVDRARQRDPSFVLTLRNAQAVSEVCRRLDGIPLAIELAAGRMGVLSAEQLSVRLDDYLRLLSRGSRTAEPRHRSMRATLEWSHELLSAPERMLFRRLSVFAGGWTLEAAEEVCAGEGIEEGKVLDLLSELVERSLVLAGTGQEELVRYRMLEPIRQYGRERLQESGESEAVRSRHAGYYLVLAEGEDAAEADPRMKGSPPASWFRLMEAEHANLRAALNWSLDEGAAEADGGRVELGLRLAVALFWFWYTQDYATEGRRYLEKARSSEMSTIGARLRARALNGAGGMAVTQGDYGAAKTLIEEGLALYRRLQDEEGIASALTDLGLVALWGQRDDIPVGAVMDELGEIKPRLENRRTLAWMLVLEGMIVGGQGDLERAVALHEESLEVFRELRDTGATINTLGQLGAMVLFLGDYERAVPGLQETLRLGWESDYALIIQFSLFFLACAAAFQEQPSRAAP
jgi:predicted ATPase/DNA-binding SARP family transcriptional activator